MADDILTDEALEAQEPKIYVTLDPDGVPTGFYRSDIHGNNIPSAALEITQDVWQECIDNQGTRCFIDGVLHNYKRIIPDADLAVSIRARRDALLASTDYLLMTDYPILSDALTAVKAYRQELRDITTQETFPQSVVWPTPYGGEL